MVLFSLVREKIPGVRLGEKKAGKPVKCVGGRYFPFYVGHASHRYKEPK